jgi:hypothetical protein
MEQEVFPFKTKAFGYTNLEQDTIVSSNLCGRGVSDLLFTSSEHGKYPHIYILASVTAAQDGGFKVVYTLEKSVPCL